MKLCLLFCGLTACGISEAGVSPYGVDYSPADAGMDSPLRTQDSGIVHLDGGLHDAGPLPPQSTDASNLSDAGVRLPDANQDTAAEATQDSSSPVPDAGKDSQDAVASPPVDAALPPVPPVDDGAIDSAQPTEDATAVPPAVDAAVADTNPLSYVVDDGSAQYVVNEYPDGSVQYCADYRVTSSGQEICVGIGTGTRCCGYGVDHWLVDGSIAYFAPICCFEPVNGGVL